MAGAFGTLFRFAISGWVARHFGETFPNGTLLVNLLGCFMIGFLYHLLEERALIDPVIRTALLIGFLGAFTTFSSYGLQILTLVRDGEFFLAGLYVCISNLAGFILVWMGYSISKSMAVSS